MIEITRLHIFQRHHTGPVVYKFDVDVETKNVRVFLESNSKTFGSIFIGFILYLSLYINSGQTISPLRISYTKTVSYNNLYKRRIKHVMYRFVLGVQYLIKKDTKKNHFIFDLI